MTEIPRWFWRRLKEWAAALAAGSRSGGSGLLVAARLDLGSKKSLLVVTYAGRRFLVASGAETVSAPVEIGAPGGRARTAAPGRSVAGPPASRGARARRLRTRREKIGATAEPAGSRGSR